MSGLPRDPLQDQPNSYRDQRDADDSANNGQRQNDPDDDQHDTDHHSEQSSRRLDNHPQYPEKQPEWREQHVANNAHLSSFIVRYERPLPWPGREFTAMLAEPGTLRLEVGTECLHMIPERRRVVQFLQVRHFVSDNVVEDTVRTK